MKFVGSGLQDLPLALPFRGPVPVPDALLLEAGTRDSGTGAGQAAITVKLMAINIGNGEVSQVKVVDAPCRAIGDRPFPLPLAEKYQLETKALSRRVVKVSGVIPPLGAEIRMVEVIAWKRIAITGGSLAVNGSTWRNRADQKRERNGAGRSKHPQLLS